MNPNKLKEEIEFEIDCLAETLKNVEFLSNELLEREHNIYDISAAAMLLSQFYNSIENIMKRIIKYNKISISTNSEYHIELFNLFSQKNNQTLPLLFSDDIVNGFVILRKFRHIVRNSYSFQIDIVRLKIGMNSLNPLFTKFVENLKKSNLY